MQQRVLLQILLLAQHVSGTTMPIIRSPRVSHSGRCLWYFILWFSSCWSRVELRVMCLVCRMLQGQEKNVGTRVITLCPYFPTVPCVSPTPIMLRMFREIKGVVKTLSCGVRPLTTILKYLKLLLALKLKILKNYWRFYCLLYYVW